VFFLSFPLCLFLSAVIFSYSACGKTGGSRGTEADRAIYRALTGLEFNRRDLAWIKDRLIFRAGNQVCQHRRSFNLYVVPNRRIGSHGDVVAGFRSGIARFARS